MSPKFQFSPDTCWARVRELTASKDFLIAFSGGLDSTVLLHTLLTLREQHDFQLRAIHVNHNLSKYSKEWQQHCETFCNANKVTLITENVTLNPKPGDSLEALARDARYAVFEKIIKPNECLLTAHNADDQVETVLLQLLRGAGLKGLSAMSERKQFANGEHIRPLLKNTRAELAAYAELHQLEWIEDDSNRDTRFDRNYLRHAVIPKLTERWPSMTKTIARSAKHCADAELILQDYANQDLVNIFDEVSKTLDITKLMGLSKGRRLHVIRQALHQLNLPLPSEIKLQTIDADVIHSSRDANPCVAWANVEVRRYRDVLYILTNTKIDMPIDAVAWDLKDTLTLPNALGNLSVSTIQGGGIALNKVSEVSVQFRSEGERIQPKGRDGTHTLKKLWQEWGVPPWERNRIPLLYHDDKLIAVVGYCVDRQYAADENEVGLDIQRG